MLYYNICNNNNCDKKIFHKCWKQRKMFQTFEWSGFISSFFHCCFWSYWIENFFFLVLNKWPRENYQVCNLKSYIIVITISELFNPFQTNVPFLYPLKVSGFRMFLESMKRDHWNALRLTTPCKSYSIELFCKSVYYFLGYENIISRKLIKPKRRSSFLTPSLVTAHWYGY